MPGSKRPDETIMFAAHWDAYGIGPPDAQGRKIRLGANDDALTVYSAVRKWEHSEPRENVLMYVGGVIFAVAIRTMTFNRMNR